MTLRSWLRAAALAVIVLVSIFAQESRGLQFQSNSLSGTESVDGLTQKQLAILRYFAQLTILQESPYSWNGWGNITNNPNCDGNTCLRYQLSSLAYAASLAALKTPAYASVCSSIVRDAIDRMIDVRTWMYIEQFSEFRRQPTFPDPVAYKNIMYSGHLAQMITLYEAISGDFNYSLNGWDFKWNSTTSFHYTLASLISAITSQMDASNDVHVNAGLACEPDSVFIICNSFPRNAFLLYEALHPAANATLIASLNQRWATTIATYGISSLPDQVFKLDYLLFPGVWEPIASSGSDAWALAWIAPWWPSSSSPAVPLAAFTRMSRSSEWRSARGVNSSLPGEYLQVQAFGGRLFPFDSAVASSLWPLIEKQFCSSTNSSVPSHITGVLSWMEASWGTETFNQTSYYYEPHDNYAVFATANLLAGMLLPDDCNGSWLRSVFQIGSPSGNTSFYNALLASPHLSNVPYPFLMVSNANWISSNNTLLVSIMQGDAHTSVTMFSVSVSYEPSSFKPTSVEIDGAETTKWVIETYGSLLVQVPNQQQISLAVLFNVVV